jgi:4-hydroxy-3-polyprenylbenzoate decarboxylase
LSYSSLEAAINDLEAHGMLFRVKEEVDPNLEIAEIQRQAYQANAPAILFENVKGSPFRAVCNLYGTEERTNFLFRKSIKGVKQVIDIKADPTCILKNPFGYMRAPLVALTALPKKVSGGDVLSCETTIDQLPLVKSWPDDGGAFITLPQVFTLDPENPNLMKSNLGMYRVQLTGNNYETNKEIGLHYQIHRGIGDHHAKAIRQDEPLKVSIFVGGPPAHSFAAVMPLPEGLSELTFGGMLAGRRFRIASKDGHMISADADFCIVGEIHQKETKPEGPFGDHLGYYSLTHEMPVLRVSKVYHKPNAIWPFTVVGRPPQEDTSFGNLIHQITAPMVPTEIPGVKEIHAVDEAGVHPLMLAIGKERYVPYGERKPQELLTTANSILGFGQASLAKYLMIVAEEDNTGLTTNDGEGFYRHLLERVDFTRDLHFQTNTTIDTLDYSGTGLNCGSKLVIAAAGKKKRNLTGQIPGDLKLPAGFNSPKMVIPGIMALQANKFTDYEKVSEYFEALNQLNLTNEIPLIIICDDSGFVSESLKNFLWVTFTRSNPSHDVHGINSFTEHKHWGCHGALIIDARIKPHHAPPLVEDDEVTKKVAHLALGCLPSSSSSTK